MRIITFPGGSAWRRPAPAGRIRAALGVYLMVNCLLAALSGCSALTGSSPAAHWSGGSVIQVPEDFPTIQDAVNVAQPGDLVLIHPGVYHEAVSVTTPHLVLRGTDRDTVILDGGFLMANGITATGAGSVVENLTVRDYIFNGLLFTGVTDQSLQQQGAGGSEYDPLDTAKFPEVEGFRASYVTSYDNGLYGIYAFDARDGIIEDSYGSGQADSGIYVGQCRPCHTEVRGNTVEHNAVGIEVTNASEGVDVLGNLITRNRVGLTLQSDDLEALAPQHGAIVAGNVITNEVEPQSPEQADGGFGIGVGIGGGTGNTLTRNLVTGNTAAGVGVPVAPVIVITAGRGSGIAVSAISVSAVRVTEPEAQAEAVTAITIAATVVAAAITAGHAATAIGSA